MTSRRMPPLLRAIHAAVLLCTFACGGDDEHVDVSSDAPTSSSSASTDPTTGSLPADSTGAETSRGHESSSSSPSSTSTAGSATTPSTTHATNGAPTEPCPPFGDETGSNALTGDMGFAFADTPYCDYVQIDRVGVPLVVDLLITSKDEYRSATPTDDHALAFNDELVPSLIKLRNTLIDAIEGEGWLGCSTLDIQCQAQATKLIIPDLLYLGNEGAVGFRDGRRLDTPMPDRVLGQFLLDLEAHDVSVFAEHPLNPPENDVPFPDAWPYLAEPH
jgi:hypothetical protein